MQKNQHQAVFQALNLARTKPSQFAKMVELQLSKFVDEFHYMVASRTRMITKQGQSAWKEAIAFLNEVKPLPAFVWSDGLFLAALDHTVDLGQSGKTGHTGSDGSSSSKRIERHGKWLSTCGQNISYGTFEPADIVLQLIVDDGVSNRGHRKNIYNPAFNVVGCAVGKHKGWKILCVMDFAGGMQSHQSAKAKAATASQQKVQIKKQEKKKDDSGPQALIGLLNAGIKEGVQSKGDEFEFGGKMLMSTGHMWHKKEQGRTLVSQKSKTMTRTVNGKTTKTVTTTKVYSNGDRQQQTITTQS